MKHSYFIIFITGILALRSCNTTSETNANFQQSTQITEHTELPNAKTIIGKAIRAHGGKAYDSAYYGFTFRQKKYTFKNTGDSYKYTRTSSESSTKTHDVLTNTGYKKIVNGVEVLLAPKEERDAKNALNSVLYFATLPYKLNDNAVIANYIETTSIHKQNYYVIKVTFTKHGGGDDYDDVFYYWIHTKTYYIDYLAYTYQVNGGGQRLRAAYNRRNIDGIIFQDYRNYKNITKTTLKEFPNLLNTNQLKEVSKIELKAIENLRLQH